MRDSATSSWRRLSDDPQKHADVFRGQASAEQANEARQLATWPQGDGRSALSTEPVRVLIVDDDIESSDSLELMLLALGHSETRVAYSGHAALAMAAEFKPSLILLELVLPDISGYEVARMLRANAQTHDLRLIALTSSREHAGRELARVSGFERYLLKPVAALDLSQLITDARMPC